ncbi:MAG: T9SS type A sorting domain-containing protein [Saprospiraceae bacterium]
MITHTQITNIIICIFFLLCDVSAETLHVGTGQDYATLTAATDVAVPGDTILVHEGTYSGGLFVGDLQGTSSDRIYIHAVPGEVIFNGGANAWQFSDAAYLDIRGFIFQQQTGNGLNFDDGGSYETPAHHIVFAECTFRDMNASGNNDLLKLSGLDDFMILNCTFLNGATGGSGIDMVGCHDGLIKNNHFENLGSNSIQAKGGTSNITIEANFFKNGGARAVNLGGSTGLPFFRPIDAPYEAAELKVYSNIFIGSEAPIAFVGSINCEVINNTIYLPTKWVIRILQETVDPDRFPPCGFNTFRNNIVYIDNRVNVEVNIGPNTAPETFTFSNNLWYHSENSNWDGPDLPVEDVDNIVGEDPLFAKAESESFVLLDESPAIGEGFDIDNPEFDYDDNLFSSPRSIGAFEGGMVTGTDNEVFPLEGQLIIQPNPFTTGFEIRWPQKIHSAISIRIYSADGKNVYSMDSDLNDESTVRVNTSSLQKGHYFLHVTGNEVNHVQKLIKL